MTDKVIKNLKNMDKQKKKVFNLINKQYNEESETNQ